MLPADVVSVFGRCTGGTTAYFPKCLLLVSARLCRREDSGQNVVQPAKVNPQEVDECPAAAAQGMNSHLIEIPLILEPCSPLAARRSLLDLLTEP